MRKITLLFAVFLSLLGVTQVKAETLTANFDSGLPDGWSIVGDLTRNSDRARSGSGVWTTSQSDNANYLITEAVEGSITFYARAYGKSKNSYVRIYEYDGSALGTQLYVTSNMYTSSSTISFSQFVANLGDYKGQVAIALNYAAIDDVTYTPKETAEGPALTIKDGDTKITTGYAYNFSLVVAGTTHTFTLSNPGTAAVEGLAVSETGSFGATLSATTIAAGGEATLTITMPSTTGSSVITISSTTEGIADFVINASGTVRDPNKVYLDFSDGLIPDGWSSVAIGSYASSYGSPWAASEGYVSQSGSSSSYEWAFTSPKLTFTEGETIFFETEKYSSSTWYNPSIKVQYKTEDGEWTTIGSAYTDDTYDTWTTRSVTIPTADAKYIRFSGWYVKLRNIYGGELPSEPKMVVTEPATLDFGLCDKDASAPTKTFTIANTGKAVLNGISVSSANAAFTITGAPTSLAAGADAEVTITMSTATAGALSSLITVSATDMADASFTVTGVVKPAGMPVEEFTDGLPANWTNASWTFADGVATGKSATAYLTTPKLSFSAGDFVIIKAKRFDSDAADYITVEGSNDNGSTWTAYSNKISGSNGLAYPDYGNIVLADIPTTVNKIRFVGYYCVVDEIYGLNYDQNAPVLGVTLGGAAIATGYADNFGTKVKTQPAAHTYTITNTGTGTLTGTITSSVPGHFTVSESSFSLAKDASLDFDLNLVFNETYEAKASVITIHPTNDGLADVVINASATTSDPNIWEEDFEGGIPETWTNENDAWKTNRYGHTGEAGPGNNKTAHLITPRLQATAGQILQFDVIDAESETYFLNAEYSTNLTDWTLIENYITAGTKEFTAPAAGYYWLRFTGNYTYVDNFYGFKEAPLEHDAKVTAQSIPATGNEGVAYTATITVKEMAGKAEELTAKFFIGSTQYGDDVVETVEANGTKTFSVTFTPADAISGNAHFTVTNGDINLTSDNVAVEIVAAPVLDEESGSLAAFENWGNYPVVKMVYSLKAGWNTIILPFAVNDLSVFGANAKAFAFSGFDGTTLGFTSVNALNAQTPYILHVEEAKSEIMFTGVTNFRTSENADDLKVTQGVVTFQGTYAPVAAGSMTGNYGVTNAGKIQKATSAASMMGFRAYFTGIPANATARLSFDETTSIGEELRVKSEEFATSSEFFDLQGRRVAHPTKGLYIVNGRKVVVK